MLRYVSCKEKWNYRDPAAYDRIYVFQKDKRKAAVLVLSSKPIGEDVNYDNGLFKLAAKEVSRLRYHRSAKENKARHERLVTGKHGMKRPK